MNDADRLFRLQVGSKFMTEWTFQQLVQTARIKFNRQNAFDENYHRGDFSDVAKFTGVSKGTVSKWGQRWLHKNDRPWIRRPFVRKGSGMQKAISAYVQDSEDTRKRWRMESATREIKAIREEAERKINALAKEAGITV